MGIIESVKQRPILAVFIVAIIGFGLFSGMLSIFEEGKYVSIRPVDGSEVQGLQQEIHVDLRFENIHTIIASGDQKPSISLTGINTSYQWNTTPSISFRPEDQKIFYHAEHMFPGFGFYELSVRVYYLNNGNVSDVRVYSKSSTFEIVEKPVAPAVQEEPDQTGITTTPVVEPTENPIVNLISKSLGFIVLIAGVVAIYFFYLRKRYKLP